MIPAKPFLKADDLEGVEARYAKKKESQKAVLETLQWHDVLTAEEFREWQKAGRKRRAETKAQDEKRKEDPLFCYFDANGKWVRLTGEFLNRFGGPFNREMFQTGMEEGLNRLNITLTKDPGEAAKTEEIFDLLFDKVVDQNITYTIKNFEALGVIDFSAWPVHP